MGPSLCWLLRGDIRLPEVIGMVKRSIAKWWIFGEFATALAVVIFISSLVAALARHDELIAAGAAVRVDDPSLTAIFILAFIGLLPLAAGLIAQLLAWVRALRSASAAGDARWAAVLLWVGIASIALIPLFGVGLIFLSGLTTAYLVGGPDSRTRADAELRSKATMNRWAWWGFAAIGVGMLWALAIPRLTGPGLPLHGDVWGSIALAMIGAACAACGAALLSAAWWAAVFNSRRLRDQRWFRFLVRGGVAALILLPLLGIGLIVALGVWAAYVREAPDATGTVPVPARRSALTGSTA